MYSNYVSKFLSLILILVFFTQPVIAFTIVSQPEDVSVSASVAGNVIITPTDDGGGGILTGVIFSGWAYPGAVVYIWKDGIPKTTTTADMRGYFTTTFNELYSPSVLYTLYAIDKANRRSLLLNYPVVVKSGYVTEVSGIRFTPTVAIDKTEVKQGDYITVSGYALPNADLDIVINGLESRTFYLTSNADGTYKITIPLLDLKKGDYNLHVNYSGDGKISKVLNFTIGDINILSIDLVTNIPGDCNADQIINLIDFSVMAFWYGKPNPPRCVDTNNDNIINLVDFSILAFYWTG